MNLSPHSFVTVDQILADVTKITKDPGFDTASRGHYISQMQQALEELSFDTYYDERYEALDVPENLRLDMPKGAFNIRQVYLFNGDKCNIGYNTVNVYHKRDYFTGGNGFVARNNGNNLGDPFHTKTGSRTDMSRQGLGISSESISNLKFYSVSNGIIMLSPTCRAYEKIMLKYNGIGCNLGDTPCVPSFLRQAVKGYVAKEILMLKLTESIGDPTFNQWQAILSMVENKLEKPFDGDWAKAERRVKVMDNKEREDLKEYLSKLDA